MACDSPLGNTGAAKDLCNMAIANAVDMAFGMQATSGTDALASTSADAEVATNKSACSGTGAFGGAAIVEGAASGSYDCALPANSGASASGSLDSLEAQAPLGNTAALGSTLNNTLGNTAAARQLCDDAISAAVGSAVNALGFNGTSGSHYDLV